MTITYVRTIIIGLTPWSICNCGASLSLTLVSGTTVKLAGGLKSQTTGCRSKHGRTPSTEHHYKQLDNAGFISEAVNSGEHCTQHAA